MNILDWIMIYLGIGVFLMAIFDVMHYLTKSVVDQETYEANGFSNTERTSVIVFWPTILISLMFRTFSGQPIEEPKDEKKSSDDKSEETMD